MAMADRPHLQLHPLERVLVEGSRFAFPLELRWEFIEWFAGGKATEFVTPHIPGPVLKAARAGDAIILLFFGHEARSLEYVYSGQERSAYDLIFDFVRRNDLPSRSVWFVNGNLAGELEYKSWKCRRYGNANIPDLFETRFVEPFSYLIPAVHRIKEAGFELTLEHKSRKNPDGFYQHEMTRLVSSPLPHETNCLNCREYAQPTNCHPSYSCA